MELSPINPVKIEGPPIIPTIDPPVTQKTERSVVYGIEVPVINIPKVSIDYPVINVPTQEEINVEIKDNKEKEKEEKPEKPKSLPNIKPPEIPYKLIQQVQPTTKTEIPADNPHQSTFTVLGTDINLPDPSLVATAGAVAVVTTASTMVATTALNAIKNAAEPLIKEASKNKFKIKIKQVKPVLHYVLTDSGRIDIFEYSSEGTKLIDQTDNVEQYIRDQVEINALYEIDNKIIIDDVIEQQFTKEGQQRFRPLFSPAKKVAKKLSARLSF